MPVGIEAWVFEIPPITRTWLALSVVLSVAVVCGPDSYSRLAFLMYPIDLAMSISYTTSAVLQLQIRFR